MLRFCFVMEQTLGHVTHAQNLARWAAQAPDIAATWIHVKPEGSDIWERFPGVRGNWSLKASLRAKDALNAYLKTETPNALFFHTQTLALFSPPFMKRIPGVVSLDATPINYDTVGEAYGHKPGAGWLEKQKFNWHCAVFQQAAALTTWCHWAKESLVSDYGADANKITVIPPGVDMANWSFGSEKAGRPQENDRPIRLLIVGGDFERKGGRYLIDAYRTELYKTCTLDVATKEAWVGEELKGVAGATVHYGLTANSAPLKALYANADIFVFPTLADCLPIAVMEAMAAGLPVVATDVGALREEVVPDVNGLIVPPKDSPSIIAAVQELAADGGKRREMALQSRVLAERHFNAETNYNAILDLLRSIAK